MGIYLNSATVASIYKREMENPYFVDKSMLLAELFAFVGQGNSHVCITRPRRFGKTIMANMVSTFFGKSCDSHEIFDRLKIAGQKGYQENINHYDVIHIDFSKSPQKCVSYQQYIERIEKRLLKDLGKAYPQVEIEEDTALWDVLCEIYEEYNEQKFVFVLDEWDCIFHKEFVTEEDKKNYLTFLSNLLKDQAYVALAYMTGILPIAKYSSGSELNMFAEFTMANSPVFSEYFGFSESEVDSLFDRYLKNCPNPRVTRQELREWYNGYCVADGGRVYNPRSVVFALKFNKVGSYWTSSGPYDEISYYIEQNVDGVKKELALMVSGEAIPVKVQEYAAASMNLSTKDEIFSAMVVYGFLSYEEGKVRIPDRELMNKFNEMIQKEQSLGYINRLAKESDRMLDATLNGDTNTMAEILSYVHDTETPILSYNHETELSAIVNLAYLSARDCYRIEREDKAGTGYVDFIFYPYKRTDDAVILELKVDHTPEEAIEQIKEKKYALRFAPKLGEERYYTGRILAVGISYTKQTKKHQCRVEILEN